MLYDWYSTDCDTNTAHLVDSSVPCSQSKVWEIVKSDFENKLANHINFVHIYVWDQDNVYDALNPCGDHCPNPPVQSGNSGPGFTALDYGGPQSSPNRQWDALKEFIALAQANNIYVQIHF